MFEIISGKDRPVCQAYSAALQEMAGTVDGFKERPWCGANLNPSVEGFPTLYRTYITDFDDLTTLRYRIESFFASQDQYILERRFTVKDREANRRETEIASKTNQLSMWRYSPPLDVDNDGATDNVLEYQAGRCDSERPIFTALLIVDPSSLAIDEMKTRRIFGDPRPYPIKTENFIPLRDGRVGVFRHGGRDYIYAWGNEEAWNKNSKSAPTSKVYLRQKDKVSTVCHILFKEVMK